MAESAENKRALGRWPGTLMTIMILIAGVAASTAFAATVTAPKITGDPTPDSELTADERHLDAGGRDAHLRLAPLRHHRHHRREL